MNFEQWYKSWADPNVGLVEDIPKRQGAKAAWDFQQAGVDAALSAASSERKKAVLWRDKAHEEMNKRTACEQEIARLKRENATLMKSNSAISDSNMELNDRLAQLANHIYNTEKSAVKVGVSSTGRTNMHDPQIQNLPGTLAHAIEKLEAKHGPAFNSLIQGQNAGNQQAYDPSEPHRSMARKVEDSIHVKLAVLCSGPFTHRDKGGRYRVSSVATPAGETMRKIGRVVVYYSIGRPDITFARDVADFVAIMQLIELSDS